MHQKCPIKIQTNNVWNENIYMYIHIKLHTPVLFFVVSKTLSLAVCGFVDKEISGGGEGGGWDPQNHILFGILLCVFDNS